MNSAVLVAVRFTNVLTYLLTKLEIKSSRPGANDRRLTVERLKAALIETAVSCRHLYQLLLQSLLLLSELKQDAQLSQRDRAAGCVSCGMEDWN